MLTAFFAPWQTDTFMHHAHVVLVLCLMMRLVIKLLYNACVMLMQ
jgi:hypothetical protein